jgi:hypothetical protein
MGGNLASVNRQNLSVGGLVVTNSKSSAPLTSAELIAKLAVLRRRGRYMRVYEFTTENIAEVCQAALGRLIPDLPAEIGSRLVPNRKAKRHGSETRMFEFHVRDRMQPGLLEKNHFGYMVIYDPVCRYHTWFRDRGLPCQLLVRFYANRHRIYDKKQEVISALWQEMLIAQRIIHGFVAHQNEQMIGLFRPFEANGLLDLEEQIYQAFLELIPYWHPKYAAAIDAYGHTLTREEVEAIIAGRKRFQPSRPRSPVAKTEYSRHIPLHFRQAVLRRDGNRCLKCGATGNLHIDHILPVAKGGLTKIENLQALCAVHNLSKGDRESVNYRTV